MCWLTIFIINLRGNYSRGTEGEDDTDLRDGVFLPRGKLTDTLYNVTWTDIVCHVQQITYLCTFVLSFFFQENTIILKASFVIYYSHFECYYNSVLCLALFK